MLRLLLPKLTKTFRFGSFGAAIGWMVEVSLAVENARLFRQADELNRLKDEFLATLSHELRTPLAAVLGWARMLRGGQLDSVGASQAVEAIEDK